MEIKPIDVKTRAERRSWFEENAEKESFCWVICKRGKGCPNGVLAYAEVVEESLCFGWIDSTQKRGEDGRPIQRFTPRRKKGIWCEQNVERCRRLIKLGDMTPSGEAVLPDMNPEHFVFYDWVIDALKADSKTWNNYQSFPDAYKRIKIWRIQHYADTKRMDQAHKALRKFVEDTHNGRMQSGWSDGGKLLSY